MGFCLYYFSAILGFVDGVHDHHSGYDYTKDDFGGAEDLEYYRRTHGFGFKPEKAVDHSKKRVRRQLLPGLLELATWGFVNNKLPNITVIPPSFSVSTTPLHKVSKRSPGPKGRRPSSPRPSSPQPTQAPLVPPPPVLPPTATGSSHSQRPPTHSGIEFRPRLPPSGLIQPSPPIRPPVRGPLGHRRWREEQVRRQQEVQRQRPGPSRSMGNPGSRDNPVGSSSSDSGSSHTLEYETGDSELYSTPSDCSESDRVQFEDTLAFGMGDTEQEAREGRRRHREELFKLRKKKCNQKKKD